MKLTYIYQSSFILECKSIICIFDYYKSNTEVYKLLKDTIESTQKKVFVFVSHSHYDHYNPIIFEWENKKSPIIYILSEEVKPSIKKNLNDLEIVFLENYSTWENTQLNISIKTYGSTDIGCSFLINIDEKSVFHAGDLNNWHWNEEYSQIEADKAEKYYLSELHLINKDISKIDYLFYPIDMRLGKDYLKGISQFLELISIKTLIPMHFGESKLPYKQIEDLLSLNKHHITLLEIDKEGYNKII